MRKIENLNPIHVHEVTDFNKGVLRDQMARLKTLEDDPKKDLRLSQKKCILCFYTPRLAGQAFTEYQCLNCEGTFSHPNTAVPVLCEGCSTDSSLCCVCGSDLGIPVPFQDTDLVPAEMSQRYSVAVKAFSGKIREMDLSAQFARSIVGTPESFNELMQVGKTSSGISGEDTESNRTIGWLRRVLRIYSIASRSGELSGVLNETPELATLIADFGAIYGLGAPAVAEGIPKEKTSPCEKNTIVGPCRRAKDHRGRCSPKRESPVQTKCLKKITKTKFCQLPVGHEPAPCDEDA